jgi:hypothetical protein
MADKLDVDSTVRQIEDLLHDLGEIDSGSRALAEDVIRLLMQLYGEGLDRIIGILHETQSQQAIDRLAEDKLVAALLLLHGLHPTAPEVRIGAALERLERRAGSHHLVLEGIENNVARIRVEPNGSGAPTALGDAIRRAIVDCAPDVAEVAIEGLAKEGALVQIEAAPVR